MRVSVEAIRERIGKRQGQRTDRLVEELPQVPGGIKTRDYAAAKGGLGNDLTYRQAKAVVERGAPELVRAMDTGALSIGHVDCSFFAKAATRCACFRRESFMRSTSPFKTASSVSM